MLPELVSAENGPRCLLKEYSSADTVMRLHDVEMMLQNHRLMVAEKAEETVEVLR